MEFYQHCLGGELSIQMMEDSPEGQALPMDMRDCVVQATLKMESLTIMGTDLIEEGFIKGNGISILLDCSDEMDLRQYFDRLSNHSTSTQPITLTNYGGFFGGLTDQFGIKWLFHSPKSISKT